MTDRSKVRSRFEAQPPMEKSMFKVNSTKMTFQLQTDNTPKFYLAMSFRIHGPGKAACSSQHCYSSSLFHKMSSWATPKAANFKTGRLWCPDTQHPLGLIPRRASLIFRSIENPVWDQVTEHKQKASEVTPDLVSWTGPASLLFTQRHTLASP